jgi:hypothetical protein
MRNVKATKIEIDRRVTMVADMMIAGIPNSRIVQHGSKEWNITERQVYDYIEKARLLILESTKGKIEVEVAKAQRRYEDIYRKAFKDNLLAVALNAERARCELRGLNSLVTDSMDMKPSATDFEYEVIE